MMRHIFWTGTAALFVCLAPFCFGAKVEYPALETRATGFEVVARFAAQPTHVAVLADGRIVLVLVDRPSGKNELVQLMPDGKTKPYPSAEWSGPRRADGKGFGEILGLYADPRGFLAVVDRGKSASPPRIAVFNTDEGDKPFATRQFGTGSRRVERFVQDLAFDGRNRMVCLATVNKARDKAALIVLGVPRGKARIIEFRKGLAGGAAPAGSPADSQTSWSLAQGLNVPIAFDANFEWLYVSALQGNKIWRVRAADLADPRLSGDEIMSRFEEFSAKPMCSHMCADAAGNVYVTDESQNGIGVASIGRGYRLHRKDPMLNWPDDICLGLDGQLYVTVNQIRRASMTGRAPGNADRPYLLVRTKPQ